LDATEAIKLILTRLREAREQSGKTADEVEEALILGKGWVDRFEAGTSVPTIDMLIALSTEVGTDLASLVGGVRIEEAATVHRVVFAEGKEDGSIRIHFPYGEYDAVYDLADATLDQFEEVLGVLRDSLVAGKKTEAVTDAFLKAVELWPHANPSDLWWFVVSRAYGDLFNHPATSALLNVEQSWKRTGAWALERVLVRHYGPALKKCGVRIWIPNKEQLANLLPKGLNPQKIDVVLTGEGESADNVFGEVVFFGAVHVKASLAERRDDDVPTSLELMENGYTSIRWTMDAKAVPGSKPFNRGEFGAVLGGGTDKRSEKRIDIEDRGWFSACFSYNMNTSSTPDGQEAKVRIEQLDFTKPDGDAFTEFVCDAWKRFQATNS
jgi:transcriptional regulator with XRE-family HTH domain